MRTCIIENDALARIIACRGRGLYFVFADLSDDTLSFSDQRNELAIDLREAIAQLFEYHSGLSWID